MHVSKVAVIGAGTMGSGIAAHLANIGVPVVLLDLVPAGADRSIAHRAVERMTAASPPPLIHPDRIEHIRPGSVEDLSELAEVDWIAEAVVERLDVKQALYRRIDEARRPGTPVSSNTSTIPLSLLTEGMPEAFRRDFVIAHFFNPVRYMRLLELVTGPATRPEVRDGLAHFCDRGLGKGVVQCRDTPGFLANRVGCYALQVGMVAARELGLTVEEADAVMGRPAGIPKTGVFALYDLIGLDLMLDVAASFRSALPNADEFHRVADGIPLWRRLVDAGYTGNKGGAGFYRVTRVNGQAVREAVDLDTGEYRPATRPEVAAVQAVERGGLRALLEHDSAPGRYAWRVLSRTLAYAASLIPEVSEELTPVDDAMKLGYGWTRGPFEMIDELGVGWFRARLEADGLPVPALLEAAGDASLYRARDAHLEQRTVTGVFRNVERPEGVLLFGEIKRTRPRVTGNEAASLWDVGEGVACLEFHTKANALGPVSMQALAGAVAHAEREFRGLVLHCDAPHFSVGFDLGFVLGVARDRAWSQLDEALLAFQETCKSVRYAKVPVVGAPAGMALGGGFEVLLHCHALTLHVNTVTGLVEPLVGLVPSGGGCKELLWRWTKDAADAADRIECATRAFEIILMARTASSPPLAEPLGFLGERYVTTMSRERLLFEARGDVIRMAEAYRVPGPPTLVATGAAGREAMGQVVETLDADGGLSPHDRTVASALARVLAGGDVAQGEPVSEDALHTLEREAFLELAATPETVARIEHMLATGRPLRN